MCSTRLFRLLMISLLFVTNPVFAMELTSEAFVEGREIQREFTCQGANRMPPIHFDPHSDKVQSLVLVISDPDAPMGAYYHLLAWNIPPETTEFRLDTISERIVFGANSAKKLRYTGPCPPWGRHHYHFNLYGLDTTLNLPMGTKWSQLKMAMEGHIIEEGQLMGTYARKL